MSPSDSLPRAPRYLTLWTFLARLTVFGRDLEDATHVRALETEARGLVHAPRGRVRLRDLELDLCVPFRLRPVRGPAHEGRPDPAAAVPRRDPHVVDETVRLLREVSSSSPYHDIT